MDINFLKFKTIEMFMKFIERMEVGYIDEYCNILNNIAFIQSYEHLDGNVEGFYNQLIFRSDL